MGMAASQARYLALTARKSNLEYQGQQINQERTILSQQCTTLYNNLLALEVPTPPSTSDYTKIEYSGTDGASQFTLGTVLPSTKAQGKYNVEIKTEATGPSLAKQYNTVVVNNVEEEIHGEITGNDPRSIQDIVNNYYIITGGNNIRKATVNDFQKNSGNPPTYSLLSQYTYVLKDDTKTTTYSYKHTMIAGQEGMPFVEAEQLYPNAFNWQEFRQAITNTFVGQDGKEAVEPESFYVYFKTSDTGVVTPYFVLQNDLGKETATSYEYTTGLYTKTEQKDECMLTFDSEGRITAIDIPVRDSNGDIIAYNTVPLDATTKTDTVAYEDAYAKYEYAQYLYDKEQQEINAKTEIIQQEDKNLELKLTRLDNERTAINTELDAVKKVIGDNIDKSYKTFSG